MPRLVKGPLYFLDFVFYRTYRFYLSSGEKNAPEVYGIGIITLLPLLNLSSLIFIFEAEGSSFLPAKFEVPILFAAFFTVLTVHYIRIYKLIGIRSFLERWQVLDTKISKRLTTGLFVYIIGTFIFLFISILL